MARKLKTALKNYQLRAKLQQEQERKAQNASKSLKEHKVAHAARVNEKRKAWIPFAIGLEDYTDESLLLIGEGDFSFAREVANKFPSLPVVATCLDTRDELEQKYADTVQQNLQELEQMGVPIVTEVDATQLAGCKSPDIRGKIGMVMFNFPHLGLSIADQAHNIQKHQQLLKQFFEQCAQCQFKKIVLTLFEGEPYVSWQPKLLAREAGYKAERSGRFPWEFFSGYSHQLTSKGGAQTSKKQSQREARMYLFVRAE